jgi:hypothetical protein
MTQKEFIITFAVVASVLIGACVPTMVAAVWVTARPDPEAEYWRGVYDVCQAAIQKPQTCLRWVATERAEAREDWYGDASPGYAWPLPEQGRPYPAQQADSY